MIYVSLFKNSVMMVILYSQIFGIHYSYDRMKYISLFLLLASFVILSVNSSCVSSKKSSTTTVPIEKQKKESVTTPNSKGKKKINVIKKDNPPKAMNLSGSENKDVFVVAPPTRVGQTFHQSYPSARDVLWTKQKSSTHYKANFFLDDNKQSVIYAENGDWIETSTQILPDQLPQQVYNAIKHEYPGVFVVSATSIKNVNNRASYSAVIRKETKASEREVTLTDQGLFLK